MKPFVKYFLEKAFNIYLVCVMLAVVNIIPWEKFAETKIHIAIVGLTFIGSAIDYLLKRELEKHQKTGYLRYFLRNLIFTYICLGVFYALGIFSVVKFLSNGLYQALWIGVVAMGSYIGYLIHQYFKLREKMEALENERKIE